MNKIFLLTFTLFLVAPLNAEHAEFKNYTKRLEAKEEPRISSTLKNARLLIKLIDSHKKAGTAFPFGASEAVVRQFIAKSESREFIPGQKLNELEEVALLDTIDKLVFYLNAIIETQLVDPTLNADEITTNAIKELKINSKKLQKLNDSDVSNLGKWGRFFHASSTRLSQPVIYATDIDQLAKSILMNFKGQRETTPENTQVDLTKIELLRRMPVEELANKIKSDPKKFGEEYGDALIGELKKVFPEQANTLDELLTKHRDKFEDFKSIVENKLRGKPADQIPQELLNELRSRSKEIREMESDITVKINEAKDIIPKATKEIENKVNEIKNNAESEINRIKQSLEKEKNKFDADLEKQKERIKKIFEKP